MVWTAKYTRCRPMPKKKISHHQCDLVLQLLRLWPIAQFRLQKNLLR